MHTPSHRIPVNTVHAGAGNPSVQMRDLGLRAAMVTMRLEGQSLKRD